MIRQTFNGLSLPVCKYFNRAEHITSGTSVTKKWSLYSDACLAQKQSPLRKHGAATESGPNLHALGQVLVCSFSGQEN